MTKQNHIEQLLIQSVIDGRWKLFDRLPPERILAEEMKVNRTTLRSAITSLAAKGIFETRHGSGTYVRALPSGRIASGSLQEKLDACMLIVPPIIRSCSMCIRPSQILGLERLFPMAGAALRNSDMNTFVQAQMQFFTEAARVIGNESVNASLSACLPDAKSLLRLLESCDLPLRETVFARLAGILSALRHADAEESMTAAGTYFSNLKALAESV
ncbi:MAG: FadR family transcriptional regulator [Desulfovibrionaceae bacterium]|nr:FadR family transcriptional regulator [Desulfovibrionaceae bacterium]